MLRYTHFFIVKSDLIVSVTEFAGPVVILVHTIRDNDVADVVDLNLADFANLVAYIALCFVLHFAVLDGRTALVIGDFNVVSLAVEAGSRALVIFAVVNCRDTYVRVVCKVLPVEAFQAVAVAVLVVAAGDGRDTAAIRN